MKINQEFKYHVFSAFGNACIRAIRNITTLITAIDIDDDNVGRATQMVFLKMDTIHK